MASTIEWFKKTQELTPKKLKFQSPEECAAKTKVLLLFVRAGTLCFFLSVLSMIRDLCAAAVAFRHFNIVRSPNAILINLMSIKNSFMHKILSCWFTLVCEFPGNANHNKKKKSLRTALNVIHLFKKKTNSLWHLYLSWCLYSFICRAECCEQFSLIKIHEIEFACFFSSSSFVCFDFSNRRNCEAIFHERLARTQTHSIDTRPMIFSYCEFSNEIYSSTKLYVQLSNVSTERIDCHTHTQHSTAQRTDWVQLSAKQ